MQRDNLNVCAVAPAWAIIRPANPRRPDRLLAFVCEAPLPARPLAGVLVDEWKIIDAAGREFDDSIFCYDEAETNS
jgi:hypothetical protein